MLINQRFKAVQNGSTGFPNYLTTGFCDDFFFTNAHCFDVFKTMFWRQHIHILVLVEQHQQMWCIDINVQVFFGNWRLRFKKYLRNPEICTVPVGVWAVYINNSTV